MNIGRKWLRRLPLGLAVVVLVGAFVAHAMSDRALDPAERQALYYLATPTEITGNEELNRALPGLFEAIRARVKTLGDAVHGLLVTVPANNTTTPSIQVNGPDKKLSGLPVPHYLMEWQDAETVVNNPFAAIEVRRPPEDGSQSDGLRVDVQIRRKASEKDIEVEIRVGEGEHLDTCGAKQKEPGTVENDSAGFATVVDAVASCILVHRIRSLTEVYKTESPWEKSKIAFGEVFDPLLGIGDSNRQRHLIVGIERYYTFATTWRRQPSDARDALKTALDDLHEAVGGDSAEIPRYPLAEYLYVHAATAARLGIPDANTTETEQVENSHDFNPHVSRAFRWFPYSCSRWSEAVAHLAEGDPAAAREAWTKTPDDTKCKSIESRAVLKRLRSDARAQVVNSHWYAGDFASAIAARCEWRRVLHRDKLPAELPPCDCRKAAEAGAGEPTATAPPALDQKPAELLRVANNFESALDYLFVEGKAAHLLELLPFQHGILGFTETTVEPLRQAASVAVCDAQALPEDGDRDAVASVQAALEAMKISEAECRLALQPTCAGLERAIGVLTETTAHLAHLRAKRLDDLAAAGVARRLSFACRDRYPRPKECPPDNTGATHAEPGPAGVESKETEAPEVSSYSDLRARIAIVRVRELCIEETSRTEAPEIEDLSSGTKGTVTEMGDLLRLSVHSSQLHASLDECAQRILAARQAPQDFRTSGRFNTVVEGWPFRPPAPDAVYAAEVALDRVLWDKFPDARATSFLSAVVMRYATLWPALDAYLLDNAPDVQLEMGKTAGKIRADRSDPKNNGKWVHRKEHLMDLWNDLVEVPSTQRALDASALATSAELLRLPASSFPAACDAVDIALCAPVEVVPRILDACNKREKQCSVVEAKVSYEAWVESIATKDNPDIEAVFREGLRRALAAREDAVTIARQGLDVSLHAFVAAAESATHETGTQLAVLRIATRLRENRQFETSGLSKLSRQSYEQLLMATQKGAESDGGEPPRYAATGLSVLQSRWIVAVLANEHDIHFLDGAGRTLTSVEEVEAKLPSAGPCGTSGALARQRWAHRFLGHVALNPAAYALKHGLDKQSAKGVEISDAYQKWCAWGANGTMPLVVDEPVLALSWILEEDAATSGVPAETVLSGDLLGPYVASRLGLRSTQREFRSDDPEAALLAAREAFRQGKGAIAVHAAMTAQKLFAGREVYVVDGRPLSVMADARMLLASTARDGRSYLEAANAYAALDSPTDIQRLRAAAANIELYRNDLAMAYLSKVSPWCVKGRLLRSILWWREGRRDQARELSYDLRDLLSFTNRDADRDPICGALAGGPVFLGEMGKNVSRMILRERSDMPSR